MESSFPSLTVRADALVPQGSFAEAQAEYLHPDPDEVEALVQRCEETKTGIVAHFYMDAELQGALVSVGPPHTFIADSLQMSDTAVKMAEAGKQNIIVLGVDFMSENVRAVLDAAGYGHVDVYRLADIAIGCSLAESAEAEAYTRWLQQQAKRENALHVVYINTSLRTKAVAHSIIPTITCTSSNVVQTILQAAAQIPDVSIAYGPDTYMGGNLYTMFTQLQAMPDEAIRALHPAHDQASVRALLGRFEFFQQGVCIVHHMFGDDVVRRVQDEHGDALLTAHLEVPGEMFALAAKAQGEGRGVVGSTSNILQFILAAVDRAGATPGPQHVPVVLGTESGMITSIVRQVQGKLQKLGRKDVALEVIFPVANEAVAAAEGSELKIVPGVAGGEGCSVAGGCATCPYMKMNSMDALQRVLARVGTPSEQTLGAFHPKVYTERVEGRSVAEVGSMPILHMRHFQKTGYLPDELVQDVVTRGAR
jgi:quinolinate synthase